MLGLHCCVGFPLVVAGGNHSLVAMLSDLLQSLGCRGAWASVAGVQGLSGCGSPGLDHRLSSCGHKISCSTACGIFSIGIKPMAPTPAGRFSFTTEPPGKPYDSSSFWHQHLVLF